MTPTMTVTPLELERACPLEYRLNTASLAIDPRSLGLLVMLTHRARPNRDTIMSRLGLARHYDAIMSRFGSHDRANDDQNNTH